MVLAATLGSFPLGQAAVPAEILVIPSGTHPAYGQLVAGLRAGLAERPGAPALTVGTLEDYRAAVRGGERVPRYSLVVTAGIQAAEAVVQSPPSVPVLHTLVPRLAFARLASPRAARISAIYLDQPLGRQFALLRLALPEARRVAVLLGPASQDLRGKLQEAARAWGFAVNIETVSSEEALPRALMGVLENADALLAVPDALVYNARTIHHILLTAYHYKIPMLGLSPAYIEAGAALALYATAEQIGRQAAEVILEAFAAPEGPRLPPSQHPKYFTVAVNERVAASLGLRLPPREALQQALEARVAAPQAD